MGRSIRCRGSACSAQVTVADEVIGYPYVKNPDLLILMSIDAANQFVPTLKPGGLVLYLPFDKADKDGLIHDESGAGNDGHVFGANWVSEGKFRVLLSR